MKGIGNYLMLKCCIAAVSFFAAPCLAASGVSVEAGAAQAAGTYEFTLGSEQQGDWSRVQWPLDGLLMTGAVRYEHGGTEEIRVLCEVGIQKSMTMSGTGKDWDWRPWEREGLSDYSETDSRADLSRWELLVGTAFDITPTLGCLVSIGYQRLDIDFEDSNLSAWYDYGADFFTADGLAATYELGAAGSFLGIAAAWQVGERLLVLAEARYSSLDLDGEGDWIRVGKHFNQEINATGREFRLWASYQMIPSMAVALQYVHVSQESDGPGRHWGTDGATVYDDPIVRSVETELSYWGGSLIWRP